MRAMVCGPIATATARQIRAFTRRLPRVDSLPDLVARESPLYVSHPPPSWHLSKSGHVVQAASIRDRRSANPTRDPFADDATDIRPNPPRDPLDPVWAFSFDDAGRRRGGWHRPTVRAVT